MIFDKLNQIGRYSIPYAQDIHSFLNQKDLADLREPEIEIRGRDLFVRIMRYRPKPAAENKFETHKVYADVQVIMTGREIMQVSPSGQMSPATEYNQETDFQFYHVPQGEVTDLVVSPLTFVVFFPGEAHRPSCLAAPDDGEVYKLVFKVRIGK